MTLAWFCVSAAHRTDSSGTIFQTISLRYAGPVCVEPGGGEL